jgi:hypothetical protein
MITSRIINSRIDQYGKDLANLQASHDEMVKDFQRKASENQTRYAQISGAIAELQNLLTYELPPGSSNNTQPDALIDRLPGIDNSPGDNLGSSVVHRELDQPYSAPGKACVGDYSPDPGDPVGHGVNDGK